ncbi:polyketide synthase dehydratase domain-containing protein [Micromonospora sp. NBC_01739]|uniref:polyketide synthase dehydratase domain-containing protein n=1 Tax=Micromonospora sp. NBC_01739 TaxID=2975985 RepID=UPI002E146C25|nr:polyketide synthase dehydratase domain-containing protein [Micromonospora sp. NBC_01739]
MATTPGPTPRGPAFAERLTRAVLIHEPGRLLVTTTTLSPAEVPVLDEPTDPGAPLLPAAHVLEALAQGWVALTGHRGPPVFETVEFGTPLVVGEDGVRLRLIVSAEPGTDTTVVVLRGEHWGRQVTYGHARLRHPGRSAARTSADPVPAAAPPMPNDPPVAPLRVGVPDRPPRTFFVEPGRSDRRLRYREITTSGCVLELTGTGAAESVAAVAGPLVLGDPGVRAAFLRALHPWAPDMMLRPSGVDRIWLAGVGPYEQVTLHATHRGRQDQVHRYDLEIRAGGRIVERWTGLRLRPLPGRPGPWPAQLLGPYLSRRLAELTGCDVGVVLEPGLRWKWRRQHTALAVSRLLGADPTLHHRRDGRPEVGGGWWISTAHGAGHTFAVAARTPVGCDLEPVLRRDPAEWRRSLGAHLASAELIVAQTGESPHRAGTRVWSALEALHKAGATAFTPLTYDRATPDGWLLLTAGSWQVATCATTLRGGPEDLVVAVATPR